MGTEIISYKLVDQEGYSRKGLYGETMWLPVGTRVFPTGDAWPKVGGGGYPCGPGVLHAYCSPEVAVIGRRMHLRTACNSILLEICGGSWDTDGLKRWTQDDVTVASIVDLPILTDEELTAWAIVLAPRRSTRKWAINWLSNNDRSLKTAKAARWGCDVQTAMSYARGLSIDTVKYFVAVTALNALNEMILVPAFNRASEIINGSYPPEDYDRPLTIMNPFDNLNAQ